MIDLDELIAPARAMRRTYEVPGLAKVVVLSYTPIGPNNAVFLDAALRAEARRSAQDAAAGPAGLDVMRETARLFCEWCAPTLAVDGEERTADLPAFLERLIVLAPATFSALTKAVLSPDEPVPVDAIEGNS
jgi:hypothetical protein